ncbi:MAG: UDP-N-acetylglucosamine 2-epimerase (non-hydrolyzing) [Bacteroidales bacterium]
MSKKIITIIGARPQFIKAGIVSKALKKVGVNEILIHTGQHFDNNMSQIFFHEMEIPKPAYNLSIHSLPHGAMTARMLESIEQILMKEKPSAVVVYGDTNSTLAGALAAQKLHIPIAHIEAGLRSFNMRMPEETNRVLTDRISSWLFCPTDKAIENLQNEGYENLNTQIIRSGDVMQDASLYYKDKAEQQSSIIKDLSLRKDNYILCTMHRQENIDNPIKLKKITSVLNQLNHQSQIVLPLHPRTKKALLAQNINLKFTTIEPVGYLDMIQLVSNSKFVMTDSGGVQKEAFFFHKYCLTMREETEWTELVEGGFNILTGTSEPKILESISTIASRKADFTQDLYGNGKASERIAKELAKS